MNARDACIRSVTALSLSRQSINQSHHINHINNRSSPRGNPLPTRTQPLDVGRAMAARVPPLCPCVYPPPCVYPGYTHTPSASPPRRSSTRRSGHVHGPRAGVDIAPPLPHHTKNEKQKQRAPPLLLQKCTNKHTTGAVVVVFNPPEGPSDHTRAPACAMDNERCHVSETCGSCVPSTRTGHDSRKTTHAHRPRASHRHRRRRCRVVARIARRQCATRACVRFARRPRTRSSARYPSPPSPRRPSRERDVARARDADENPARRTDATDRRRRPTTNDDDEDESIRTQGRRYGTRGRVSTRAR